MVSKQIKKSSQKIKITRTKRTYCKWCKLFTHLNKKSLQCDYNIKKTITGSTMAQSLENSEEIATTSLCLHHLDNSAKRGEMNGKKIFLFIL